MPKAIPCFDEQGVYGFAVMCPGCGHHHVFNTVDRPNRPKWEFNGNVNSPTFHPSMLTWVPRGDVKTQVCHSFVRDGNIEFLGDCTAHSLRGTVPLPEV